jgi:hypothetical protein
MRVFLVSPPGRLTLARVRVVAEIIDSVIQTSPPGTECRVAGVAA